MAKLTVKHLVSILKKVPEKRFRIMELASELIDEKGKVDVEKCMDQQGELNLAIVEVESYIKATRALAHSLVYIDGSRPDREQMDWMNDDDGLDEDEA